MGRLLVLVGPRERNDAAPGPDIGRALADFLTPLVTAPGTGLILSMLVVAGVLLALDMSLPAVMGPGGPVGLRRAINALFRPAPRAAAGSHGRASSASPARPTGRGRRQPPAIGKARPRRAAGSGPTTRDGISNPGGHLQSGPDVCRRSRRRRIGACATAVRWRAAGRLGAHPPNGRRGQSIRNGSPVRGQRLPTDAPAQSKLTGVVATAEKPRPEYHLPPLALLEDIAPRGGDSTMDHRRNAAIIVAKLASFNIPARVDGLERRARS